MRRSVSAILANKQVSKYLILMRVSSRIKIYHKKQSASISMVLESQADDSHHVISKEKRLLPMSASRSRSAITKLDKICSMPLARNTHEIHDD